MPVRAPIAPRAGRQSSAAGRRHQASPPPAVAPVVLGNAELYRVGRQHARPARVPVAMPRRRRDTGAAAPGGGTTPAQDRRAVEFAVAVDRIASHCGPGAKQLLLSGHPRLTPEAVLKIARTHPDRQRFALAQARGGRPPLERPPAGVESPFDTRGPGEVLNRLGRNAGALDKVADGLRDLAVDRWPDAESVAAILAAAEKIARQARQMKPLVRRSGPTESPRDAGAREGGQRRGRKRKPFDPRRARRDVAAAAGVTAKNLRDLPRALADTPPTAAQRAALLTRLRALEAAANRLAAVVRRRGHDPAAGPSGVPGTYVVFFRLARPAAGLRVGALGTFDFPPGTYAYLGSAFGGGGVRSRTGRHLTRQTPKKWNVDWLKPHCAPVAVWWTHDRRKVEFAWADVLAALPGASFPAKGFGAGDNKHAAAHLVRFDAVPAFDEFRRRVSAGVRDHAPVHQVAVENWAGTGWPG